MRFENNFKNKMRIKKYYKKQSYKKITDPALGYVAVKIFVLVISRKFYFHGLWNFPWILQHTKSKLGGKFSLFRKTKNQTLANIFDILQNLKEFLIEFLRIIYFWDTLFIYSTEASPFVINRRCRCY